MQQIPNLPTFNIEAEDRTQAAEAYTASPRFVADAISWASDEAHEHAGLVDVICAYYVDTRRFDDAVDDLMDGELEL